MRAGEAAGAPAPILPGAWGARQDGTLPAGVVTHAGCELSRVVVAAVPLSAR